MNRKLTIKHLASATAFCTLLILAVGSTDDSETGSSSSKVPPTYNQGDSFQVGYTSYNVIRSVWSLKLSDNQFMDDKPDAMFLFVELVVRNNDKKARSIPPFALVDENGAEYETSSKGWALDDVISSLDSLNPGVKKQGIVIFDVPQNHTYKLKLSGGYWSSKNAYVNLNPK